MIAIIVITAKRKKYFINISINLSKNNLNYEKN